MIDIQGTEMRVQALQGVSSCHYDEGIYNSAKNTDIGVLKAKSWEEALRFLLLFLLLDRL